MNETKKGLPGLKAAREAKKMSQAALARALSVPERQIQRWEACESAPSVWHAVSVAQALDTSVEELLQGPLTLLLPDPDNTRQMAMLGHVIGLGRVVADAAKQLPSAGFTPFQRALVGLMGLAVKEAEAVFLGMKAQNKPCAMNALRVLCDMTFSLGYIAQVPAYRDYRACLFLIEGPRRKLQLYDANLGGVPMDNPTVAHVRGMIEAEVQALRDTMAKLDHAPDDPDHWTSRGKTEKGKSAKQRATLGGWSDLYTWLYDMGSGYVHGDGFAIENYDQFPASDLKGVPDLTGILLMEFIQTTLNEFPVLERIEGVIPAFNAFAERNGSDEDEDEDEGDADDTEELASASDAG